LRKVAGGGFRQAQTFQEGLIPRINPGACTMKKFLAKGSSATDYVTDVKDRRKKEEKETIFNAQFPMPNYLLPITHYQFSIDNF
jgi:hypothetical protein